MKSGNFNSRMRGIIPLVFLAIAMTLVVACGGSDPTVTPQPSATPAATSQPPTPTMEPESDAFSVTIQHKFGETTLTEAPERVVLVGLVEQDAMLALGVVPVGTSEWYGGRPGAIFPWAEGLLGDAPAPEVLTGEMDFEKIAALQPDVIVGLYAGITEEQYGKLSEIAPTVAQPAEYVDWGIPWDELTLTVGRILGKEAEAQALVDGVAERFEQARADYPEFQGATGVIVSTWGWPQTYYPYASQDPRGRFMASLGFDTLDEIDELAGEEYGATVSLERIDLMDVDALVWFGTPEMVQGHAPYRQLDVYNEGRDLYLGDGDPVYDALNFSSVLSLPFAVDSLAPMLAAAVDGDPATEFVLE